MTTALKATPHGATAPHQHALIRDRAQTGGDSAGGGAGLRPVLSVAEAAELLGVSEWLVLQQIRVGTLPHKRCGRRIVLSRERLMAWLNDT
jgi:excisionase family DNA binding protein